MADVEIQFRRDSAASWIANNPILSQGELGYETDTGNFKIGNGTAIWTALPYAGGNSFVLSQGGMALAGTGTAAPTSTTPGNMYVRTSS